MSRKIEYGHLMHEAMRRLIQTVLTDISQNGLPGAHHFFITFDTMHPDVEMADWLSDRYPEEMTVVLQHWFDNLNVDDAGFAVTLNFGDNPETLFVPFDAIRTFVDPSVEFGLRFEPSEDEEDEASPHLVDVTEAAETEAAAEPVEAEKADADVVSLDSFRK